MDLSTKMKYEISLWEVYINDQGESDERKICTLGSNIFQS
jgi:hypothetical protein